MAGTQELDRLLEELRLTSLQMTSGLPPPSAHLSPKSFTSYTPRLGAQNTSHHTTHQQRYQQHNSATRSSSALGLFGGSSTTDGTSFPANSSGGYHSTFHTKYTTGGGPLQTERRVETLNSKSMTQYYPVHRSPNLNMSTTSETHPRHQATYTTVLKQRSPATARQMSQVHLTIDPECGPRETNTTSLANGPDLSSTRREHMLETELTSARRELAQLRRAMSLIEERQRHDYSGHHLRRPTSPVASSFLTTRSASTGPQQQQHQTFSSSSSYHTQHNQQQVRAPRSISSTFQRTTGRQDGSYNIGASSSRNTMNTRTWNLRKPHLGSESDLVYKRVTNVSSTPGQSTYSAHRERLRQEREKELLMRQQRQRQMAASTLGLNEQHLQRQVRNQQQYRSMSAVNTGGGGGESFEEVETIALQPIGRGVQDVDSRTGSITTLNRGTGGSMMDGLHRSEEANRTILNRRGYSSTQFLNRQTSNSDLIRPNPVHQSHTMLAPDARSQSVQNSRFTNSHTLMNHQPSPRMNGSVNNLSTVSSTIVAPSSVVQVKSKPAMTNGWKTVDTTSKGMYANHSDMHGLSEVQNAAPIWYRPKFSREEAISLLREQPPGSFLIRDSTTFKGAYGLALKVAQLPPKVAQKSGFKKFVRGLLNDLQSELVRHYLIEVVNPPLRGVRLKGFASEPVFSSLAALIHRHTLEPLALPCRLTLPLVQNELPTSGITALPLIVIGQTTWPFSDPSQGMDTIPMDAATVTSSGSVLGRTPSEIESAFHMDGAQGTPGPGTPVSVPVLDGAGDSAPFLRESTSHQQRTALDSGLTIRCLTLGSVDSPQWNAGTCFSRAVDKLIPLATLTATECDHGISRVRYTEVQLHVSVHDGVTIIDLSQKLFLRRHLPNHILIYCGIEGRNKEFQHPEHQTLGIVHPRIFGIVVRKGISECTTHIFSECDPAHTAESIVHHIRSTYPHLQVR